MSTLYEMEAPTMADRRIQKLEWDKQNTVMQSVKLNRNTDADILEYLADKSKQTIIKAAIREYMSNHPDA